MTKRLSFLVVAMCAAAVLRVLAPSPALNASGASIAEAIVRSPSKPVTPIPSGSALAGGQVERTDELAQDIPGNAFAVRPPPSPPYVPPTAVAAGQPTPPVQAATPAPVTIAATTVAAQPTPPPAPMPFQVVGTWDDGKDPGVFLAGPHGTVLARSGATLQSEYKVGAITEHQIALVHLATNREVRLAVTRPPPTPRPYP